MNEIIGELKHIITKEKMTGITYPRMTYCYLERFGRTMDKEMNEITQLLGCKKWFTFHTKSYVRKESEGMIRSFLQKMEKNTEVGKEYRGCVLIRIVPECGEEKEFEELLSYLKSQNDRICPMFVMEEKEWEKEMVTILKKYFCIREVYAKEFTVTEQQEIMVEELKKYQVELSENGWQKVTNTLECKKWDVTDRVEDELRHMVQTAVYHQALEESNLETAILQQLYESVEKEKKESVRTIGFVT